jgi:hypothetical protein
VKALGLPASPGPLRPSFSKEKPLVIGHWILAIDYLNSRKLALLPIKNIQYPMTNHQFSPFFPNQLLVHPQRVIIDQFLSLIARSFASRCVQATILQGIEFRAGFLQEETSWDVCWLWG